MSVTPGKCYQPRTWYPTAAMYVHFWCTILMFYLCNIRFMVKLKHLELRFSKLSVKGLMAIAEACKELEFLDLFGCANLTSRGIEQARTKFTNLNPNGLVRPNFYIPRSVFHTERYGHWNLYDERFQTNVFQI